MPFKTQNTMLHMMHFLRPRVAKAPYIFESQLMILIQRSHQHSFILLIFLHLLYFLFTCAIHIYSYIYIFCIFQKQLPFKKRQSDQKNGLDQVHFFKTIGVSLKKYGNFLSLCSMSRS